mmetsp:Transcript_23435/g.36810  ORF Transcript_23435/g.36810 Transcript_23435/m.36810 type:complete len:108 (+) Transcript_23435:2107-2430(+)|eukprot:325851-Amorphochlora_amoeboformis.AAC.1
MLAGDTAVDVARLKRELAEVGESIGMLGIDLLESSVDLGREKGTDVDVNTLRVEPVPFNGEALGVEATEGMAPAGVEILERSWPGDCMMRRDPRLDLRPPSRRLLVD